MWLEFKDCKKYSGGKEDKGADGYIKYKREEYS